MRKIYLSAHMDDAALSCGGLIADQVASGEKVEVWTFMCGSVGLESEARQNKRHAEDAAAMDRLGVRYSHYGFLDAMDMKTIDGARLYPVVFSPIHPDDKRSIVISHILNTMVETGDTVMCPLALGNHVDHLVIRSACERAGIKTIYYVDFPYVDYLPDQLQLVVLDMIGKLEPISEDGLRKWQDVVGDYESQKLYPTQDLTRQKIKEYWGKALGIYTYTTK